MLLRNVLVYGFSRNEFVFMSPALRLILGNAKFTLAPNCDNPNDFAMAESYDAICINCGISFHKLDFILERISINPEITILCVSWQEVSQEALDEMLKYGVGAIMIDLENEEEFTFCRNAILAGKAYRSKNSFLEKTRFNKELAVAYENLPPNQKYAFHYIMCGKSQKEFFIDFGYKAFGTASTHWQKVLQKFGVDSVIKLRNMYS